MELHILGPVELRAGEQRHRLGPPRWNGVLFYLALNVGQTVTTDALMERLGTSRETVHSYIHGLRAALKRITNEVRIVRRDRGYTLLAERDRIDYHHFFHLRRQASALADEGRLADAVALLREAEQLWTGPALAGQRGEWAEQTRRHLSGEKLSAIAQRIRLERRLGRTAEHVNELTRHVAENPQNEELVELLMRALHGRGQTDRALDEYRNVRQRLIDTTGLEPGRALQDLQDQLLHGGPDEPATEPAPPAPRPPNNLDRLLPDFVGRQAEIEELVAAYTDPVPGTPHIIAIHGMPGVGKSTFANHLAHRLMASYPDGQLYVDLGAYGARGPLDPSAALADLLGKIGVPQIPPSLEARADLWRTRLAGRSLLLLLDDASDREQVHHLLPGSSASLVIITSRHRITGIDAARPVSLRPLAEEDGASLVRAIVTVGQLDDDESLHRVLGRCAGLPLAIRLATARLRTRTTRTVRDLAIQLDNTTDLLGEFHDDDDRSIRVSFEFSYRCMPASWQRAFRLLSQHPAGEFTIHAAAAILGEPIGETVPLIDHLIDYELLQEDGKGRCRFHDLLRTYAQECAKAEDDAQARTACRDRLGDYFLAIAERTDAILRPFDRREPLRARPVAQVPVAMPDADSAQRRMEMESTGLIAYAQQEYLRRPEIAHAAAAYLDTAARWNEAGEIHEKAAEGWRAMKNPAGEAAALVDLSHIRLRCGHPMEAVELARQALALYQAVGSPGGQADALDRLGLASLYSAEFEQAIEHFDDSAKLRRSTGDDKGEADELAHSGQALFFLGRYDNAVLMFERALTTYRRLGAIRGQVEVLNNLGDVQVRLRRPRDAYRSYTQSMSLHGDVERPQDKAIHLANIATCHLAFGDTDKALALFLDALDIYRHIDDRFGVVDALDGLGLVYQARGDRIRALDRYEEALRIARDASESAQTCRSLRHLGTLHADAGDYRLAVASLEEALAIARDIHEPYEQGMTLATLSECLFHIGRTIDGRSHAAESAQLMRMLGINHA